VLESNASGNGTEGTLGFAWHANRYLKFEQGVVYNSDRSWQWVAAWEWSFGGD
jgi:transposase